LSNHFKYLLVFDQVWILLVSYLGGVNPNKKVTTEVREIDIYFTPNPEKLGYSDK